MIWNDRKTGERYIDDSEAEEISRLLIGRTVTKVADDKLTLDDGTKLRVVANEGCGGCSAGWYELKALNGCENAITRAEVVVENKNPDDRWDEEKTYRLFVYADNQKVSLVTVEGDDGNGYYGSGFEIVVAPAPGQERADG